MEVLFVIAARGGSERVPRKNLQKIGGLHLLGFKALSAKQCRYCSRLIVSTDSPEIQEVARQYGVEVPFMRPPELATSTAASVDVVLHAMSWIEEHTDATYDAVMLLEPSTPFVRSLDYDNAVKIMVEYNANVILAMREMEVNSAFVGPMDKQGCMGQIIGKIRGLPANAWRELPKEYTMNGAFYLAKWDFLKKHRSFFADEERTYGCVMDRYHSVDIDEVVDLRWAEFLVKNGYVDMSHWQPIREKIK